MKRFLFLGVAMILLGVMVNAISYERIRVNGVNTAGDGEYELYQDSSDTFTVDTVYSDTIEIGDYKWLHYDFNVDGFNLADSANDSVQVIVQFVGSYNGRLSHIIKVDTITEHAAAIDSTLSGVGVVGIDTSGINQLYLRTIVSDSFIAGAGETGNTDTTYLRFSYEVVQNEAITK